MESINDEDKRKLNEFLNRRGYIVVGSHHKLDVGHREVRGHYEQGRMIDQPLLIIAETDRADFEEQWSPEIIPDQWEYYYRVITD